MNLNDRYGPIATTCPSSSRPQLNEGFALVPLADLPNNDKGRYAFVPAQEAKLLRSTSVRRMAKSQDDLDCYGSNSRLQSSTNDVRDSSFTSLPPNVSTSSHNESSSVGASARLRSAFSTDFVPNKSLILVDQKSQQRYAIVPTAEDEELVDANEEIIQMHNGRAHRYAVIPAASEDEEYEEDETCLSGSDFEMSPVNEKYATIKAAPPGYRHTKPAPPQPLYTSSPLSNPNPHQNRPANPPDHLQTPSKNHLATQKLFEILSTPPRKPSDAGLQSCQTPPNPSRSRYHSQHLVSSTPKQPSDYTPQKLHYQPPQSAQTRPQSRHNQHIRNEPTTPRNNSRRTTAVISPRLAQGHQQRSRYGSEYGDQEDDDEDHDLDKTWPNEKVSHAHATIGAVSLMLILAGAMNSGLCLYMISVVSC